MAKSTEKTTQVASAKTMKNISLEQFEKRVEQLSISYRVAVLNLNENAKAYTHSFEFVKNSVIEFLKNGTPLPDLTQKEETAILLYKQQCLSVLGRLSTDNYQKMGVRVSKSGRVTAFYLLQYLYQYCKSYQLKQESKKTDEK
jgi:hypothetical protein